VSSDKVSTHLRWASTLRQAGGVASAYGFSKHIPNSGLDFALLSDTDQNLVASYQAVVDGRRCTSNLKGETTCSRCAIQTGNKVQAGIVIIDSEQKIRYVNFNDANVGRNPEELISIIHNLYLGENHKCSK